MQRRFALPCLLLIAASRVAQAHAALSEAAPSPDSVAQGSPVFVELTFTADVRPSNSRIIVRRAGGKRVDADDLHPVGDNRHLAVNLKTLSPGRYVVQWHVVGADAQRVAGSYGFTVGQ